MISANQVGADRTDIEYNKYPFELGLPGGNGLLVVSRVKKSRGRIPSALFDDLVLYFCDGPGIKSMIGKTTRNCGIAGPTHVVN